MKVKTFFGESLQLALKSAKEELGNDLVLLETQDVQARDMKSGQRKMVKVTVGVNDPAPAVKSWSPAQTADTGAAVSTPRSNQNNFNELLAETRGKSVEKKQDDKEILNELAMLRKEINQLARFSRTPQVNDFPPPFSNVYSELEERGVGAEIAYRFVRRAMLKTDENDGIGYEQVIDEVKLQMARKIRQYDFNGNIGGRRQKVILLIGATGVGKTTAAMKLASHQEMFGQRDIAIISSDPYGPSESLKAYSKITGTKVVEAKNFEEIRSAMHSLRRKEIVLVDTPGRSPFSPNHLEKLEQYVEVLKPTDIFVVLSMSADTRDLFLSCGLYSMLNPTGFIFNKFDETSQPGKVFSVLEEMDLPVVCFCEGKRIFIDVSRGTPEFVYRKIFDIL